jgi:isochorismate pyruvate lyase
MPAPHDCRTKEEVRAEIDRLDSELVALLAERFAYVRRMAELKTERSEALDLRRVDAILDHVRSEAAAKGLDIRLAEDLWRRLIDWNIAWEEGAIGGKR